MTTFQSKLVECPVPLWIRVFHSKYDGYFVLLLSFVQYFFYKAYISVLVLVLDL